MTADVIAVFNQKGGAGKTNLSMQAGGTLGMQGKRVLIVDIDPQGTACRWAAQAPEDRPFPARVISLSSMGKNAYKEVRRYLEDFDVILIDCPPSPIDSPAAVEGAEKAMLISDMTLIPVKPCPADVWAAQAAKQFVRRIQTLNDSMIVRVAPVMVDKQKALDIEMLELLQEDEEFPVLESIIGDRAAYRDCQVIGSTVHRVPRAAAARVEVNALSEELDALLASVRKE